MANLRGAGAPRGRGRGRGGGRGRQPRVNPVPNQPNQPEHNEMQEMRGTLHELRTLVETLLERQNRQDQEAERQLQERQAEENHNDEEEDEQRDEHDEESDRSRSPPRRGRAVQTTQYWVAQFCKLKPPAFHGKNELAEDWLMSLEKIFEVMECPGDRKAQLAIYKLNGDAHRWWKSVSTTLRTHVCPVTWEMFIEKFNEQYFPPSVQVIKEEEFLHIQQGSEETFDDYFARFTNLSRYSSYLKSNNNQSWKANRLIRGLKYDIRARLVSQQFPNMAQAVESCRMTERNLKELRILRNQNGSRTNRSEGNRENSSRKREAPWSNSQGESKRPVRSGQQYNPGTSGPRPCPKCGRYHPQSTGCDGKLICFKCQKPGHISVYCPEKAAASRPQNPGRMYALTDAEDRELPEMVQGTISS